MDPEPDFMTKPVAKAPVVVPAGWISQWNSGTAVNSGWLWGYFSYGNDNRGIIEWGADEEEKKIKRIQL
jgi:hypothetical protein